MLVILQPVIKMVMMRRQIFRLTLPLLLLATAVLGSCNKANSRMDVTEDKAEIVFDSLSYDFGEVLPDTLTSYDFVFHNIGATTLHLTSVVPSCGCTKTKWPKGGIEPGEAGVITAVYDSHGSMSGHFSKSIRVYSNAKTSFCRLSISGDIAEAQP